MTLPRTPEQIRQFLVERKRLCRKSIERAKEKGEPTNEAYQNLLEANFEVILTYVMQASEEGLTVNHRLFEVSENGHVWGTVLVPDLEDEVILQRSIAKAAELKMGPQYGNGIYTFTEVTPDEEA